MDEKVISKHLQRAFGDQAVHVHGDGRHFYAKVVSSQFRGLTRVACHRLVYSALGDHMREDIHALSIEAICPEDDRSE